MKNFLMSTCAIFLPWLVLLLKDNPGGALLALILQSTLIGWIPVSLWVWKIVHPESAEKAKANKASKARKSTNEKPTTAKARAPKEKPAKAKPTKKDKD